MIPARGSAPAFARVATDAEAGSPVRHRIELRLRRGQKVEMLLHELHDLAKRASVQIPAHQWRDHVRRLDLELTGTAADVAGFVVALEDRRGVQIMRDEVTPPSGIADPVYPDPAMLHRVAASPAVVGAGAFGRGRPVEGRSVIVAIVDSGVMRGHPDLAPYLLKDKDGRLVGHSFIGDPQNFEDEDGHGTLLAGTVLAGARGSPEVRLLPVKFIDGRTLPKQGLAADAIRWAVEQGADVIDLSWEVGIPDPRLRAAIAYAGEHGKLVVVAAGNSGADNDRLPAFPACYGHDNCTASPNEPGLKNMITVMASDRFDDRAGFSNYGKESVDIAAPGVGVTSTHQLLTSGFRSGNPRLYQRYDGSSPAAALVAGAAALLKTKNRNLLPEEIKRALQDTAVKRAELPCRWGRLNLG
jgi:subtilisin family serine protease